MTEKEKGFAKIFSQKTKAPDYTDGMEVVILKDFESQQKIWQRVHGNAEVSAGKDLGQLRRESMELAAVYRNLAAQLTGKNQELAKKLYVGELETAQILGGIARLSQANGEQLKLWQPGKENPRKALHRCYHQTLRARIEYMSRSAEPEYGVVFDALAREAAQQCVKIAQLLGELKEIRK